MSSDGDTAVGLVGLDIEIVLEEPVHELLEDRIGVHVLEELGIEPLGHVDRSDDVCGALSHEVVQDVGVP